MGRIGRITPTAIATYHTHNNSRLSDNMKKSKFYSPYMTRCEGLVIPVNELLFFNKVHPSKLEALTVHNGRTHLVILTL